MTFELLILDNVEFSSIFGIFRDLHNFEQFYFLVSRASAQIFSIWRYLDFQNIVLVRLYSFPIVQMFTLFHTEGLKYALAISKCNILTILADWYRSDAHFAATLDRGLLFLVQDVPVDEISALVSREYLNIIRMHHSAVYGHCLAMPKTFNLVFLSEVKYS